MNYHHCEENCQKLEDFTIKISRTSESAKNMLPFNIPLCPCDCCEERIKRDKRLIGGKEWRKYAEANLLCTMCGKLLEIDRCWKSHCKNCRVKANSYRSEKIKNDINFKLSVRLRSHLYDAMKGNRKVGSAVKDLGCSISGLKKYLESKFELGMSWDNWGLAGWHIDHIMPLSSFDLTDLEQFKKAVHYTNLQPLWAKENLSKGDRIK